ncbi:hypothetical protein TNCV_4669631 [Trichonephila clavipes]|nr:hypothetical protein TNCV_4669631 [Trichonephila clavipes]
MQMTYHNHLEDSFRWGAVVRLEAGQSQTEVARWLQMAQNWSPGYGINSKEVILSPRKSSKVVTEQLNLLRKTVYSLPVEAGLYAQGPVWCVPLIASSRKDWILWS